MSWKFWQKDPEPQYIIESTNVPTSTLFRWALYDLGIDTPNRFAEAAGFIPISDEAEEMERRDSHLRLDRLEPYIGFIDTMANITAEILSESFASVLRKYNLVDESMTIEQEKKALAELYNQISLSALIPTLSAGLKLGIIENPGTFTTEEI